MKEILEKLKSDGKFVNTFRIVFYVIGLILIFMGGIELMIMVYIGIFAFVLGRYCEKTMSVVRDYRLSQKINKMAYKQAEYESMQKELDVLRKSVQNQRPMQSNLFNSRPNPQQYYPNEFESEGF